MNFIRKFLFICLLIIGLASFSGNGHAKSWKGRMVDKETGQPIEGVAVAMTIHMVTATPAGGVSSFKRQIETFSGENGSFKASNYNLDLHLPVLQGLEYRYSAYKPGYKFLFSWEKPTGTIMLEKVPTTYQARREELHDASFYIVETDLFKKIFQKEEEFLENAFRNRFPGVPHHKPKGIDFTTLPIDLFIRMRGRMVNGGTDLCYGYVFKERIFRYPTLWQTEELLENLTSKKYQKRIDALKEVGFFADLRFVQPLLEALKDHDEQVRENAVWALGLYRSPSILDALIDTLIYDPHPDVRTEAAIVLKQNKEPDAVARLIEHLQDNSSLVKQMSAWVMGAYPRDQSIVRALSSILDDDDVDVLKRVRGSAYIQHP
jgi:hypothetical protein